MRADSTPRPATCQSAGRLSPLEHDRSLCAMSEQPTIVVSDVHLGAVPRRTEEAFLAFLDEVRVSAATLLINGDLFDFWFEYRTVIPRAHFRTVARLADVVDAGVRVLFMGGNHDGWGGSFLRDEVGVTLLDGPTRLDLHGRSTLVAHGDGVGRGDLKYRILKRCIRSRLSVAAFRALHPDSGRRIVNLASTTEHKAAHEHPERAAGRAAHIRAWAEERLAADPSLDLVLAGHAHRAEVHRVAPARFYANSGDWLRRYPYLELGPAPEEPPRLRYWGEPGG